MKSHNTQSPRQWVSQHVGFATNGAVETSLVHTRAGPRSCAGPSAGHGSSHESVWAGGWGRPYTPTALTSHSMWKHPDLPWHLGLCKGLRGHTEPETSPCTTGPSPALFAPSALSCANHQAEDWETYSSPSSWARE